VVSLAFALAAGHAALRSLVPSVQSVMLAVAPAAIGPSWAQAAHSGCLFRRLDRLICSLLVLPVSADSGPGDGAGGARPGGRKAHGAQLTLATRRKLQCSCY